MRKPAFKAQVDTFTANAEVVDQLEVVSKHGVSAFLGSEPQPLTSPASASDVKAHAARANGGSLIAFAPHRTRCE